MSYVTQTLSLTSNLTFFSQIISKLDRIKFAKLVKLRQTDKHQKGYTSWSQLVAMLFCQFAKSSSLRDISNGLPSATDNINHMGVSMAPSKSTMVIRIKIEIGNYLEITIMNCLKV